VDCAREVDAADGEIQQNMMSVFVSGVIRELPSPRADWSMSWQSASCPVTGILSFNSHLMD